MMMFINDSIENILYTFCLGNIRLFRACFPKTHWERYQSTKRNNMLNTNTEVVQCTVKVRKCLIVLNVKS